MSDKDNTNYLIPKLFFTFVTEIAIFNTELMERHLKYGFLIEGNKIFDTKIETYVLKKNIVCDNIIYYLKPSSYRRLYIFEPLLQHYSVSKVFNILEYNNYLKKQREKEKNNNKLHCMSNMATIYNFPPKYMTNRTFSMYKNCQELKRKID